ncbi:MAG: cation-translocating P-type ATPase [Flavobacteriales bacterium]|nr:cation-translocating P-type ATPase [Flavobacteriales bacterium]MBP6696987.1 cation-translocating P-type ATPase [Flavobacteriales bacterium]
MPANPFPFQGLSDAEVIAARTRHGRNTIDNKTGGAFWPAVKGAVLEPMFLLLLATSIIYFLLNERTEAYFMAGAILLVSAISIYQDSRSRKALAALRAFSEAQATVIRNNNVETVPVEDVVVGDHAVAEEGSLLAADGVIVQSNDFSVNESILTGEAFAVARNADDPELATVSKGTQAVSGLAVYRVTAVGKGTQLGKISTSLAAIEVPPTPLQQQITRFVRNMAIVGVVVFVAVWAVAFARSGSLLDSLLIGLTLAMSILPEEIPVAFATFLALGAWRLAKQGVIVKRSTTVETLGSATVICTDKTGTITENKMSLAQLFVQATGETLAPDAWSSTEAHRVIEVAMWASEPVPFDPMEVALHEAYKKTAERDRRADFHMAHEYPLGGKPPMMTHVFANEKDERIIACKGAPERVLRQSSLSVAQKTAVLAQVEALAGQGLRVLGVAEAQLAGNAYPKDQEEFTLDFLGLVAFNDPPKANISAVFQQFYDAGLEVKIITGDIALTTAAIAKQTGFRGADRTLNGEDMMRLDDAALRMAVKETNIFTRMFPEAKLRIINALQAEGHVVAMTGDGVNDGPALKAAHIGIAMGKRGSELAKEAASLILINDDLGNMVDAVSMGRKIYGNLKKAIQYIISIHIPIILTVSLPLFLGWVYPNIFTPLHVIFLELIMGPTCSIVYENEPLEKDGMRRPPRPLSLTFLTWKELSISIWQGLIIALGTLGTYQLAVQQGHSEELVRAMVFSALVFANIGLTLVNRSFTHSAFSTFGYGNWLLRGILLLTLALLGALLYVPVFRDFFHLASPSVPQLGIAAAMGFASVLWFEVYKWMRQSKAVTR